MRPEHERGQAFALEGLVASLVLLAALVFAIQALVITPTSGGNVDPAIREDLRQQADDILALTARAEENDLSTLVRNWSQSKQTFDGAVNPRIGYGPEQPPGAFGEMLNRTFTQESYVYNVDLIYRTQNVSGPTESVPMVHRGTPSAESVVASYTVTLYDNQTLTARNVSQNVELWQYDTDPTNNRDGYYPIPNAVDGPVYNVVEVRVVVW